MSDYEEIVRDKSTQIITIKSINELEYKYKVFIKKRLELKDILTKRDFSKLKSVLKDINNILESSYDNTEELYNERSKLFHNKLVYQIIKNNIFAGRVALKFWRIESGEKLENLKKIKSYIEKSKYYNRNLINTLDREKIDETTLYTCIKLEHNKYLLRCIVPVGAKNKDDGIETVSIPQNKNVVCIIDLNNKYIEVRSDYKVSKLVIKKLKNLFNLDGIVELNILNKHKNSIEIFKKSFSNARFINVKSIPSSDSHLTSEQTEMLIDTLKALDDFYIEKDYTQLISSLKTIDISTNEIGFIPLLLGGLSKIGISSKLDNLKDITNQPMYKLLEGYLLHQSGYLKIEDSKGYEYSIQVGINTNNIIFKSNCTDEVFIDVIRKKLINIYQEDRKKVEDIVISSLEIEETIRHMAQSGIRSFYPEYFAKLMNISIKYALKLLYEFSIDTNKIKIKYEIRCSNCVEEILTSVNCIEDIDFSLNIICSDCGQMINISKENVYICYHISEPWINSINRPVNLRLNANKPNIKNTPIYSIADLEEQGLIKLDDKTKKLHIGSVNINFGTAYSMGDANEVLKPVLT